MYAVTVQYPWKYIATKVGSGSSFEDADWVYYEENGDFGEVTIHERIVGWLITTYFAIYLSLFLTNVMFIDLYMVIRAPFKSQKARLNLLVNLSFAAAFFAAMANYLILKSQSTLSERFNVIFFYAICASNLVTSMVCVVWVVFRFRNEKTNVEFKTAIGRRYLEFFLTFCIFELPFIMISRPFYGWNADPNGGGGKNQFFSGT
jgi:hypothetical protein